VHELCGPPPPGSAGQVSGDSLGRSPPLVTSPAKFGDYRLAVVRTGCEAEPVMRVRPSALMAMAEMGPTLSSE
jgi:hypothetical protein